jgi:hypothetical protein
MSWPYSQIKTAVTGDILTATDYNNEHQNHITNNDPDAINDSSATATAMRTTVDPGESGTESLATTLTGEIQRIRFALVDLKGTTYWYETPTKTLAQMLPLAGGTMSGNIAMGNGNITGAAQVTSTNFDAGASGTAGTVDVFPATAVKGKIQIAAANSAGDTTTTITNASQAAARTYTIPDAGADASFVMTKGTQTVSGTKTFDGQLIGKGTATNDDAAAGYIGEYVASVITSSTNFPSTGTYGDLTSISLTAGDWDVDAVIDVSKNGATITGILFGISVTTGNSSTGLQAGDSRSSCFLPTASDNGSGSIPRFRKSLSGTTTIYFKYEAAFSVATPQATGRLSARRPR